MDPLDRHLQSAREIIFLDNLCCPGFSTVPSTVELVFRREKYTKSKSM